MISHEAHLPTEQDQTSEGLRLPQKDVHSQGAKDSQSTPSSRTKTSNDRIKFPKTARVLYKRQFQRIMKAGAKVSGFHILIYYRIHPVSKPRLGITVSKKHGKAHDRNRFKRVVREAFRHCQQHLPQDIEINVMPLHRNAIDPSAIINDFLQFSERLKKSHEARASQ